MSEASTTQFSKLEQSILKSKGLSDENLASLTEAGVCQKSDFATVGDAQTLAAITNLEPEVAEQVMAWATGASARSGQAQAGGAGESSAESMKKFVVDSADVVYCHHCEARQPKDYSTGDLCPECGKPAEPSLTCHWCSASGPGKFCRSCGSEMLPLADLELGQLLKREGTSKDDIVPRVRGMSQADKDVLWARIRSRRY